MKLTSKGFRHETDLCTNHGYSLLCAWMESLPEAAYPAVRALAKHGTFKATDILAVQLESSFAESPPENPDTHHVADRLLDLLGDGRPTKRITIEF